MTREPSMDSRPALTDPARSAQDDARSRAVTTAVSVMQDAELQHDVYTFSYGEERAAMLALGARSLADYVCAMNLAQADRDRGRAERDDREADRRHPGGRRVHGAVDAQGFRDAAAAAIERAEAFELAATIALAAPDVAAARDAIAYIDVDGPSALGSADETWGAALEVARLLRAWRRKRRQWFDVRGRAQQSPQPRSGIVPLGAFVRHDLGGEGLKRGVESGPAGTVASAVELLARWDLSGDKRARTRPAVAALEAIRAVRRGEHSQAVPAVVAAMFRVRDDDVFDELEWEDEDDRTLAHIAEMRTRVAHCFAVFGMPAQPGTVLVRSKRFGLSGHIDFVSADTIWDLKVSSRAPSTTDLLQLLLYWMVLVDDPDQDVAVTHVGIYNPRLDVAWRLAIADITPDALRALGDVATAEPEGSI